MPSDYLRCPFCNYPNPTGLDLCVQCESFLREEAMEDVRRAAQATWCEVRHISLAVIAGLAGGCLLMATGGLITGGAFFRFVAAWLTLESGGGRGQGAGWFLLTVVPLVWFFALPNLRSSRLGGYVEVFEGEEVVAGGWTSLLLGALLATVALTAFGGEQSGVHIEPALEELRRLAPAGVWYALPSLGQGAAAACAVFASRWMHTNCD